MALVANRKHVARLDALALAKREARGKHLRLERALERHSRRERAWNLFWKLLGYGFAFTYAVLNEVGIDFRLVEIAANVLANVFALF